MKIGLFDSGLGGLNVLKEFIKKYPNNEYLYYGDTKNVPYGDKTKKELLKLASSIIKFFEEKCVDIIIIACGTVSSNCYSELKKITNIPIYDIISPTINYLKEIDNKKILLFGTKRTIDSHIFKKSIKDIIEVKTPEFVPMIESNNIDSLVIKKYLDSYPDIDILVLGCTHYPLLINEFKKYLHEVEFIDMGIILVNKIKLDKETKFSLDLYFTKIDKYLVNNINDIIKVNYNLKKIL